MARSGQAAKLRQIRTLARNALLKVKVFLTKWDETAKEGRGQLEAACNAITRASNWPLICKHSLKTCSSLQPAGNRALRRRYIVAKEGLISCVADMEAAVQEIMSIVSPLVDVDTGDEPLFSCTAGENFFEMMQKVVKQYEQQLEVCLI